MGTTFIYNYWNNMGTFTFDNYPLIYDWNGYQIPNKLLHNKGFQEFFNTVSARDNLSLEDCNFTTDNYSDFLNEANIHGFFFDLFAITGIDEAFNDAVNKYRGKNE